MARWEEEGFASEAAYLNHLEKAAKDAEARAKAAEEALESHKKAEEAAKADAATKAKEEAEAARKEAEEEEQRKAAALKPEDIEALNNKRIGSLNDDDRAKFEEEYEKASPEQKALLAKPEGLQAFLDLKLPESKSVSLNPFAKKAPVKSIKDQVAEVFKLTQQRSSPAANKDTGSGFVKRTEAQETEYQKKLQVIEEARNNLFN